MDVSSRCLARLSKNPFEQCKFKSKCGPFCHIHSKLKYVLRFDEPYPPSKVSDDIINDTEEIITIDDPNQWDFKDEILPNNDTDFLTFLPISSFPFEKVFFYHDEHKLLWAFPIESFQCIIDKSNRINPYTQTIINDETIRRFDLFKFKKEIIVEPDEEETTKSKCVRVFQIMDQLDQYTKVDWFMELSHTELCVLYKEIEDIWNHRASLTHEMKLKYVHNGELFKKTISQLKDMKLRALRFHLLSEFERLITEGETKSERVTGALWILTGLTLVHHDTRNALPWLYQSAHH